MKLLILSLIFCAASWAQADAATVCIVDGKDQVTLDENQNRLCFVIPGPVVDSLVKSTKAISDRPSYLPVGVPQHTYEHWFDLLVQTVQDGMIRMSLDRFPTPDVAVAKETAAQAAAVEATTKTAVLSAIKVAKKPKVEPPLILPPKEEPPVIQP